MSTAYMAVTLLILVTVLTVLGKVGVSGMDRSKQPCIFRFVWALIQKLDRINVILKAFMRVKLQCPVSRQTIVVTVYLAV